jgi:hypothetical protein
VEVDDIDLLESNEASTDRDVRARLRQFDAAFEAAANRAFGRHTPSAAVSLLSALALSFCVSVQHRFILVTERYRYDNINPLLVPRGKDGE